MKFVAVALLVMAVFAKAQKPQPCGESRNDVLFGLVSLCGCRMKQVCFVSATTERKNLKRNEHVRIGSKTMRMPRTLGYDSLSVVCRVTRTRNSASFEPYIEESRASVLVRTRWLSLTYLPSFPDGLGWDLRISNKLNNCQVTDMLALRDSHLFPTPRGEGEGGGILHRYLGRRVRPTQRNPDTKSRDQDVIALPCLTRENPGFFLPC